MTRPRIRTHALAAGLLAAALALAGCSAIPTSGDVGTVTVDADSDSAQSRVEAEGPAAGDSPDAIVRGFLQAGAAYSNNYSVARSFLTDNFASQWNPHRSVSIVSAGTNLDSITADVTADSQNVSLDVPLQASLDSTGVYRESGADASATMEFTLRQVNGEWRISEAPDGIVLTSSGFTNLYEAYPVYFYTPDFKYLVPDVRWFVRSSTTGTEVVNAMLAGPSESFTGALTSAIPEGTTLSPQSVSIVQGSAEVGLSASGLDDRARGLVANQIQSSLLELGSVTSVQVSTADADLTNVADIDSTVPLAADVIALADDSLVFIDGNTIEPIPNSPKVRSGRSPALNYDATQAAYLSDDRKAVHRLTIGSADTIVAIQGKNLVGPSFDRFGWLWTAQADEGGIMGLSPAGELVRISIPFVNDRTIESIAVSRDGSRLSVLSADGGERIDVTGIIREADGTPVRISESTPLAVASGFEDVLDFSWAGTDQLAVLAKTAGQNSAQPYVVPVSGPAQSLGTISTGQTISAANDLREVRVGTGTGILFTYDSGAWQRVIDAGVTDPAYAG